MSNRTRNTISTFLVALLAVAGILSIPRAITKIHAEQIVSSAPAPIIPTSPVATSTPFDSLILQAKAVYVYDATTGKILYSKDENEQLPLASLTKIMMAITAADIAPTTTVITITPSALAQDGDTGLYLDEKWSLGSLLKYTLIVSSNDGAAAIAEALGDPGASTTDSVDAFIHDMNLKAKKLSLRQMKFSNESGLDISTTEAGAYGSAKDVAELIEYAVTHYGPIFSPTQYQSIDIDSLSGFHHQAENTDILTEKIPGLVASKTGYTDLAGGNLAIVFEAANNHPIVVTILGSTYEGRFTDMDQLIEAAIKTENTK